LTVNEDGSIRHPVAPNAIVDPTAETCKYSHDLSEMGTYTNEHLDEFDQLPKPVRV